MNQLSVTLIRMFGGRANFKPVKVDDFLPDYLGLKKKPLIANKTLEQQKQEWDAFKAHYRKMEALVKGK